MEGREVDGYKRSWNETLTRVTALSSVHGETGSSGRDGMKFPELKEGKKEERKEVDGYKRSWNENPDEGDTSGR